MPKNHGIDLPLTLTADGHEPFKRHHTDADRARWHAQYLALLEQSVGPDAAELHARELHARGGVQQSRRYRMVATLPPRPFTEWTLRTLMQHIEDNDPDRAAELWGSFLETAKHEYLQNMAKKEGNVHELDLRTFEAFKRIERERSEAVQAERTRVYEAQRAMNKHMVLDTETTGLDDAHACTCGHDHGDVDGGGLCVRCGGRPSE